ncbi:MAG: multiubiquitin domain-containing protein [Patescibacteria group bacterium]|nr:multiubiquitin domain-containing protein [Patescibacteria group bacterium]
MADEKEAYKIIVNGTEHTVSNDVVTFEQVVKMAFPSHTHDPNVVFSVTFEHAESKPHQGTLAAGGKVTVKKHGTVFDVTQTNRS